MNIEKYRKEKLMAHIVKCRICKQHFDTEKSDYALVGKRSYYHKSCYENWVRERNNPKADGDNDFWYESIVDYLYRDVKMSIDFPKLDNQWKSFTKPEKKMTPKGIYFAVRYYYNVVNGDKEKALGGIGIVPSVYKDSAQYWTDLEMRKAGTIDAIVEQIRARQDRQVQTITRHQTPKKDKAKFSLDDV